MDEQDQLFSTVRRLLDNAEAGRLLSGLKGLEKESLRIDGEGFLAKTPHPAALGSALTHKYITTDFSEALLEFVTPAYGEYWQTQQMLCDLHLYTYRNIGDELLWVSSMPCRVGADDTVPLARYGSSNVGRMKTIYRRGLGYRYGRLMQTIAGLHYNYSIDRTLWPLLRELDRTDLDVDAHRSARYFGLIRNFRRIAWLVLYLFGASPAVCRSFVDDAYPGLPELDRETLFEPYATSLRMSDLGYSNKTQSKLRVSLNSLDEYTRELAAAISTPEPAYESIGVRVDGRYRQLNANILQIENEFYSSMRPKNVARSGERPTAALRRGGVEYVELRSLDLNVFHPVGIGENQSRFIELLLLYCFFSASPPFDAAALAEADANHAAAARYGRDPALELQREGKPELLADWAMRVMDDLEAFATLIDENGADDGLVDIVREQRAAVADPDLTPSARVIAELADRRQSFFEFGLAQAELHREYFLSLEPANEARQEALDDESRASLRRQRDVEANDRIGFDEYLANYFATA